MTIRVSGSIRMYGHYSVDLDMTEAQFDALSEREQNEEINSIIDWRNWMDNADIEEVDVDELEELEEKE